MIEKGLSICVKGKMHVVGNGGVVVWMWWVDGEGTAEVSREGVDEGCCKVMWGEVGLAIPGEDVSNLGGKVVAETVELHWEVARKVPVGQHRGNHWR